jgi:flavin-dependent dehydrogenase
MQGARLRFFDRLTSYTGTIAGSNVNAAETLVEASEHGWWYTARLPNGNRVVSYMTDADIGREAGLPTIDAWKRLLHRTAHIQAAVGDGIAAPDLIARSAATAQLDRVQGDGWLATGDASAAYDPLAAQGITKALRNGILASYAAADALLGREQDQVNRYSLILNHQFAAYRHAHRTHFARETRWADSPFWRRRHAAATSPLEGAA